MTAQPLTIRQKVHQLLNNDLNPSKFNRAINGFLIVLIILNVIAVIAESEPSIRSAHQGFFDAFEHFSVAVFTIEYLLRLYSCVEQVNTKPKDGEQSNFKARLNYMLSPMAIIDLLAILPYFLTIFFDKDLGILRLLRILRLLKLSHYFSGFNIFVTVIQKELRSIMAATMVMLFLITIAAAFLYLAEGEQQPEAFGSILRAYWWAVVTMTTVGYGDVVPVTTEGKLISACIMLLGVGIVALPAGLLAARFGDELRERKKNLDVHIQKALSDGVVTEQERQALLKMADKLELKPEDLEKAIELQKRRQEHKAQHKTGNKVCPHCHKPID